jgi:hypothetical protein
MAPRSYYGDLITRRVPMVPFFTMARHSNAEKEGNVAPGDEVRLTRRRLLSCCAPRDEVRGDGLLITRITGLLLGCLGSSGLPASFMLCLPGKPHRLASV